MQQGNFIDGFLAPHVSGTYAHHQEHHMLSCSVWFPAPSLWMGGSLESRCVGRVYGADGAVLPHGTIRTVHTTSQRLSRLPPIHKLGAGNHTLQLNI